MKSFLKSCVLLAGFCCVFAQAAVEPYTERGRIDFDQFLEILAPYGRWVKNENLGWVYFPYEDVAWHPYQQGRWVYTDWGWFWQGKEPFAEVCYFYGEWKRIEGKWGWIPDVKWEPDRVTWRVTDKFCGWGWNGIDWFFVSKTQISNSLKPEDFLNEKQKQKVLSESTVSQHILKIVNYRDFVRAGPAPKEIMTLTDQTIKRHTIMSLPEWKTSPPQRYDDRYLFVYRPKIAQDKAGIQRRIDTWMQTDATKRKRDLDAISTTIIEETIQQTVEEVKKQRR